MKKVVFFDRDGVINSDVGHYYIYRVEDFKINDGIIEGMKRLRDAGYRFVIITNQGGVAKGEYAISDVEKVHQYLLDQLAQFDIEIEAIKYCPHHDSVSICDCRKPSPKMILDAVSELGIDKTKSFLIGDSPRDIQAGEAAGLNKCYKIDANSSILPIVDKILQNHE